MLGTTVGLDVPPLGKIVGFAEGYALGLFVGSMVGSFVKVYSHINALYLLPHPTSSHESALFASGLTQDGNPQPLFGFPIFL